MSENQRQQELMSVQLESYRAALGGFSEEMALDHISQVPQCFGGPCMYHIVLNCKSSPSES
ncbi:uncharacterized protein M6B38_383945 [Iris pallida]|uniref:Uncharacterized protein n=1 Tax=Iris pallida TaxID=29817 RepID=A0AAX6G3R1_IRIPA|nr:uncharacterized protein M6B38_383945 [Iris pallida]